MNMINELNHDNATHKLLCRHAIGQKGKDYFMRCHVLKKMPDERLKILVFGERYWRDKKNTSRVRYVDSERVFKISDEQYTNPNEELVSQDG